MTEESKEALVKAFMTPISSPEHMRDWIFTYLGLDMPLGTVDPESNSSPIEWLYEAYNTLRRNMGNKIPGYIVFAPREGYKTLTTAILEVLCAVHFTLSVAHMAAIESQAKKSAQYVNNFVKKIKPFLDAHGMNIKKANSRNIEFEDKDSQMAYITLIICTLQGANSEHTTLFVVDEVDVVRFPNAYEEAKMIPGVMRGIYPLNVKTSTRKFAFGLMQKEISNAPVSGDHVLHWNITDVTERCPPERHRPKEKKVERYIRPRELPLSNLDKAQYDMLSEEEQSKYIKIKAHAGCKECPLLPVCQKRLSKRPKTDYGGLWKPIDFVINQFKKTSPDMAEAQLMCWKPSSKGLVYPKFSTDEDGNTYTIKQAFKVLSGDDAPEDLTFPQLIKYMLHLGIQFFGHVDWGFRHNYGLVVTAQIPNGEWWIVHTIAIPGLELDEMVKVALEQKVFFKIKRWHADTAQPSYIKTFKKNGMACASFKKDVDAGIEAVRKQVIDAYGKRRLKVILTEYNDFAVKGFQHHHFKLDAAGNPTREPDDEEYADVMDCIRYGAQNLFKPSSGITVPKAQMPDNNPLMSQQGNYSNWMSEKVRQLTQGDTTAARGKSKSGTIFFDFGASLVDLDDDES